MRILVVEDEPALADQLIRTLADQGYAVDLARDGEEGHHLGDTEPYDAAILDLGLPKLDGLSVLKRWRGDGRSFPVLVLTARGRWHERVEGIDAGADDYLGKPFQMAELLARLRALIRRSSGHAHSDMEFGPIRLDTRSGKVTKDGVPVTLTAQEYRVLVYLMHHRERVVSRTELTEHIYGLDADRDSNTIEVFIMRLRKKLGGDVIRTLRGQGYALNDDDGGTG